MFHRSPNELTGSTHFIKDLHAKSANIIELTALMEDAFGIDMPFAEIMNNSTVGAATEYVKRRLAQKPALTV